MMYSDIQNRLDQLAEECLNFFSLGASPFTLLTISKESSGILGHMTNNGKCSFPTFTAMVGIFGRTDFLPEDRTEYYALSREMLNLRPQERERAIHFLRGKDDQLASWEERKLAMFEGYVQRMMQHHRLSGAALGDGEVQVFNTLLTEHSAIKLLRGFWV